MKKNRINMVNVAIIGAGQLGSRHLQGLARVETPLSIHLLDPSEASLALARSRYEEVAGPASPHSLRLYRDVAQLPGEIEVAISATTASHRLSSLRQALSQSRIRHVLLEKVLFQRLDEYQAAASLLDDAGTRAWVNCARRMFPGYQELKAFFGDEAPFLLQVSGGNWGLGCNGIHFCDLFAYLTSSDSLSFDVSGLDQVVHASKRPGFFEFTGTLVARQGARLLSLQSREEALPRHLVMIRSASKTALVDEVGGVVRLLDEASGTWTEKAFVAPYQSQLTSGFVNDVLAGRPPSLPDFASSSRVHVAFISALLGHFNQVNAQQGDICPIT